MTLWYPELEGGGQLSPVPTPVASLEYGTVPSPPYPCFSQEPGCGEEKSNSDSRNPLLCDLVKLPRISGPLCNPHPT